MLDILFETKRCELLKIYGLGNIHAKFCTAISNGTSLATLSAAESEAFNTKMLEMADAYILAD